MHVCVYVCMYVCIYESMYVCMYVFMYLCIYVYMYLYIYMRAQRLVKTVALDNAFEVCCIVGRYIKRNTVCVV